MPLSYLIQKEFLQIRRNSFLPKLIVVFPIVIMCVMPWVMNMEVKNVRVDVVDLDRSTDSHRLTNRIASGKYFVLNGCPASYGEALHDVEQWKADVIVEIPRHYHRSKVEAKAPQLRVSANATNSTKGTLGMAYVSQVIQQHVQEGDPMPSGMRQQQASVSHLYNPHQDYKLFMIPSLMGILIMLMCCTLPTLNIVGEKEAGTIEAINVTPVSRLTFILAKLIPYWLIAFVVMTICFVLSWLLYGLTPAGDLGLCYLLAMLLAFVFSGLGLVVSNYNDTMQQAMFVIWFCMVTMMLMSGLFTPVRSMPHWAYLTTYINPMHYFIDTIRTVFVRGGDFRSVSHQVVALSLIALVMDGWAIVSYRKNR